MRNSACSKSGLAPLCLCSNHDRNEREQNQFRFQSQKGESLSALVEFPVMAGTVPRYGESLAGDFLCRNANRKAVRAGNAPTPDSRIGKRTANHWQVRFNNRPAFIKLVASSDVTTTRAVSRGRTPVGLVRFTVSRRTCYERPIQLVLYRCVSSPRSNPVMGLLRGPANLSLPDVV